MISHISAGTLYPKPILLAWYYSASSGIHMESLPLTKVKTEPKEVTLYLWIKFVSLLFVTFLFFIIFCQSTKYYKFLNENKSNSKEIRGIVLI